MNVRGKRLLILFVVCLELLFLGVIILKECRRTEFVRSFGTDELLTSDGDIITLERQPAKEEDRTGENVWCPLLNLDEGSYIVEVKYRAAGLRNRLVFSKDQGYYQEYDKILNDYAELPSGGSELEGWQTFETKVYLSKATDCFKIMVEYSGSWELTVESISIRTDWSYPYIANKIFKSVLIFLVLDLLIYGIVFRKEEKLRKILENKERNSIIMGIGLIVLISSSPLLTDYLVDAHDLDFHLSRIENIKDGILSGVFPVRIGPDWLNGYGYAASVFYNDLLLFFPVVLRLLGISLQSAYKSYVVAVNLGTAVIAYYSFKGFTGNKRLGLVLSGAYTFSIYRLIDIYIRCALGEFSAMMFLPMIAYSFYRIFFTDRKKEEYNKSIFLLGMGLTGVVHTHVLTCEMAGIFIFLFCLIFIKKIFCRERFWALVKTVFLVLLLSAWYLYPFLYYIGKDEFFLQTKPLVGIQQEGICWNQLFTMSFAGGGTSLSAVHGMKDEMPVGIGWGLLLPFFLAVFLLLRKEYTDQKNKNMILTTGILSGLSLWMSMVSFPYDFILDLCPPIGGILVQIEFPWRYLEIATVLLTILAGAVLTGLKKSHPEMVRIFGGVVLLCTLLQGCTLIDNVFQDRDSVPFRRYGVSRVSHIANGSEYLPAETNIDQSVREIQAGENVDAKVIERSYNNFLIECENKTETDDRIELPLIYYIGYRAMDQETGERLEVQAGEGKQVNVLLPGKYSGKVQVCFEEPFSWRVSEAVSLIALIVVLIYGKYYFIGNRGTRAQRR